MKFRIDFIRIIAIVRIILEIRVTKLDFTSVKSRNTGQNVKEYVS